jgi:hypothetical protein
MAAWLGKHGSAVEGAGYNGSLIAIIIKLPNSYCSFAADGGEWNRPCREPAQFEGGARCNQKESFAADLLQVQL